MSNDVQEKINREHSVMIAHLQAKQMQIHDDLIQVSEDLGDLSKAVTGLVNEINGVKRILWGIAFCIALNIDQATAKQLLLWIKSF